MTAEEKLKEKRWYEVEEEKSYEQRWFEAKVELVVMKDENAKWLASH